MNKLVSIIVLTYNSEKYFEGCLQSVEAQTYQNIEVLIIDNKSSDNTVNKIRNSIRQVADEIRNLRFIENSTNLGYAGGNNLGIEQSKGEYIIILNPDVVLDKNFVQGVVNKFEKNDKIGSIQAKIYQLNNNQATRTIDTVGFKFFKSGRIIDIGQGEEDEAQYDKSSEIFGVNGTAPAYRRIALNSIKLKEEYFDEDFFMYAEDFDLAWRLNSHNWLAVFEPRAIAWHDRTSSKSIGGGWKEFRQTRKSQSLWLRKISWRNTWLAFIKNLPLKEFFRPQFLKRQVRFGLYLLFFEPKVLMAKFEIIKLLPKMLKKRKYARFNHAPKGLQKNI